MFSSEGSRNVCAEGAEADLSVKKKRLGEGVTVIQHPGARMLKLTVQPSPLAPLLRNPGWFRVCVVVSYKNISKVFLRFEVLLNGLLRVNVKMLKGSKNWLMIYTTLSKPAFKYWVIS